MLAMPCAKRLGKDPVVLRGITYSGWQLSLPRDWLVAPQSGTKKKEEQFGACKHHVQTSEKASDPNNQICHTRYKKQNEQAQVICALL